MSALVAGSVVAIFIIVLTIYYRNMVDGMQMMTTLNIGWYLTTSTVFYCVGVDYLLVLAAVFGIYVDI